MPPYSRRQFLKLLAASAGALTLGRDLGYGAVQQRALRFLVVGDSLIWGQGLNEEDKFYYLTADWLRKSAFGRPRAVHLMVKAHSGANLKVHPETAERLKKAGLDDTYSFHPEVNVGFPSIWTQLEMAADEYKKAKTAAGADLIMLSGSITDVSVTTILDPFGDDDELPPLIEKYCRDHMLDVLRHAGRLHTNSSIVVIGYYPMLSERSPGSRLLNVWLESIGLPNPLKPVANNPLTRKLFFRRMKRKALKRSRIWTDLSNKYLQLAVDAFNADHPRKRAILIKSPITEETTYDMPDTLVFGMGKNDQSEDPVFEERGSHCKKSFEELKKRTGFGHSVRRCEMAGLGHPDPLGSQAYYDEIRNALARDPFIIRQLARAV